MPFRLGTLLLLLALALSIAACNRGSTGALADETPLTDLTPTPIPVPTFTPTPASAPGDTAPAESASASAATGETEGGEEDAEAADSVQEPVAQDTSIDANTVLTGTIGLTITEATTDTDIATSEQSAILVPTATPVPAPQGPTATIIAEDVNIRSGPGIAYDLVGVAALGDTFDVVGKNPAGDWWQLCCLGDTGAEGWIFGPLVEVQNGDSVAVAADIPPLPTPDPVVVAELEPVALPVEPQPPVTDEPAPSEPLSEPPPAAEPEPAAPAAAPPGQPAPTDGTAGNFDPNAQYQIVHFRALGFDDNNGGIFNKGGQQLIFLTVLDQAGNGIDGVVVKNAVADNLTVVTGDKGPGKAEIKMDWDPYKLFVAQDGSGPVTSQVSNQMNNPYPHIPDIVGKLGPPDNEYAICPTVDDRCSPPFYHAHWSYEITFQKVR